MSRRDCSVTFELNPHNLVAARPCLLFVLPLLFFNHGSYGFEKLLQFNYGCTVLKSP